MKFKVSLSCIQVHAWWGRPRMTIYSVSRNDCVPVTFPTLPWTQGVQAWAIKAGSLSSGVYSLGHRGSRAHIHVLSVEVWTSSIFLKCICPCVSKVCKLFIPLWHKGMNSLQTLETHGQVHLLCANNSSMPRKSSEIFFKKVQKPLYVQRWVFLH